MKVGVIFPQTELGGDVGAVRAYGAAVEELGFSHIVAYDHVVGADPAVHVGWNGPYDYDTSFHEPMVLFGFLAGITNLGLATSILILPQRQTALVAKQAVELDLLTGGRFRLGVGVGWNEVEYQALGKDFKTRGRRMDEQIQLLRRLFTERSVTEDGVYEQVHGAGLFPMPLQRPIPIWVGGWTPAAYQRIGRLADGWFAVVPPGPQLDAALEIIAEAATSAGRDPSTIGLEGRFKWSPSDNDFAADQIARWADAGASHVAIDTMDIGLRTVDDHIDALTTAAGVVLAS